MLLEIQPYFVYLLILWHLYHAELEEEEEAIGHIPVTHFQKHGVWRALRILEKYHGVMVAADDRVSLRQTFTAGEIIRRYRERRQRVLLVCPASLRDTTWKRFLYDHQSMVECLSYEALANDRQLRGRDRPSREPAGGIRPRRGGRGPQLPPNPDAPTRAAVLRRLLSGKTRDLLLLTATPVNNSLWDLYHLLRFFLRQDAWLADRGILSVRERFEDAMHVDPFDLNPDMLYPIIDATTVKRTRQFIKRHYANDTIRGPDGSMQPIRFPTPVASSIAYDLDAVLPGFFARLEDILMPENGHPLLRMARYQPERYLLDSAGLADDTALVGLLRSALLKRFESSAPAFRLTLGRMIREHDVFLDTLVRGHVVRKELLRELSAAEDSDAVEELLESAAEDRQDAAGYDIRRLTADVRGDLNLLREMAATAERIEAENDPKLAALAKELASIAARAHEEALDAEDESQKRKVLVFSAYQDTIDWIEAYLTSALAQDTRLAGYHGRMASVSGEDIRGGIRRDAALYGFAPISTGAPPGSTEDRFDLLLCTDVLAEGMNLQQCRNVVNYDLPWNPMRLVQRHGRVDRINSPHPKVFLRTFFPDAELDALLNLEGRVRRKLAQAAASVGVEAAPIERGASGDQSFAETRDEIDRLRREDPAIYEAGGTKGAAQTGEEYRQELRKGLERHKDTLLALPWKIGSGIHGSGDSGYVFCATVGERVYLRFVPVSPDGSVTGELGSCLRFLECSEDTPRILSTEMALGAFPAWQRARQHIFEAWTFETDPANLQPKVRPLNREVAAFLRDHPPAGVEQIRLHRCLDAIETPWSRREENQLRVIWSAEHSDTRSRAAALVAEVERLGLEPLVPPEPLAPIAVEEIHLICWMAIESEARPE